MEFGNSTSGIIALQTDESIPEVPTKTLSMTLASVGIFSSAKLNKKSSLTVFSNYQPSPLIRYVNPVSLKDIRSFSSLDLGVYYFRKIGKAATMKFFNYSLNESYMVFNERPTFNGIFDQDKWRNFTVANFRKRIKNSEISFNQGISFSKAQYQFGITDIDIHLHDLFSSLNFLQQYFS